MVGTWDMVGFMASVSKPEAEFKTRGFRGPGRRVDGKAHLGLEELPTPQGGGGWRGRRRGGEWVGEGRWGG